MITKTVPKAAVATVPQAIYSPSPEGDITVAPARHPLKLRLSSKPSQGHSESPAPKPAAAPPPVAEPVSEKKAPLKLKLKLAPQPPPS